MMAISINTLLRTTTIVFIVTACGQSQNSTPIIADVPFVEKGFHASAEGIDFAAVGARTDLLAKLPSKLPKDIVLTVGAVWTHLNKRLLEEKVPLKVVFETNVHHLKADEIYLQRSITKVFGHEIQGDALRKALTEANCDDLLAVIVENSGLFTLNRKDVIILSNYVHP